MTLFPAACGEKKAAVERYGPGGDVQTAERMARWADRADADWAQIMTDFVVNGMYARGILSTSIRELCAVAALTVLQRTEELRMHLRIALRTNPLEQVREVVLQMSVYGGIPVTVSTMRLLEEVLAEPEFAAGRGAQ